MLNVAQIERYYSYFYQKKYQDPKYRFNSTKTTLRDCNTFLQLVDKRYSLQCVGEDFLWDYFLFQFQYWHDLTLENKFSDKIIIAWIVGKKAFERWITRDPEYDWQIDQAEVIKLYRLDKADVKTKTEKTAATYDSSKAFRKMYLNTEEGFFRCIELTTLFDPKDLSCIQCKYRTDCKRLLRDNYPKIYRERGLNGS